MNMTVLLILERNISDVRWGKDVEEREYICWDEAPELFRVPLPSTLPNRNSLASSSDDLMPELEVICFRRVEEISSEPPIWRYVQT